MRKAASADEGRLLAIDLPGGPDWLAFNAKNTRIAATCRAANYAVVLDIATGQELARVADIITQHWVAFEFIGEDLLCLRDGKLVRCDLRTGTSEPLLAEGGASATVAPNGRLLAVGVMGGLILYDLARKQVRQRLNSYLPGAPDYPVFSPGGRYVAADLIPDAGPYLLVIWDTQKARPWWVVEIGVKEYFGAAAFRGDTLALAVDIGSGVGLYEPDRGGDPMRTYEIPKFPCALRFRDGGRSLAVASYGGALTLLRASTGRVLRQVSPPAGHEVCTCKPSPDWSLLAGASEGGVLIWPSGLA